MPLRSGPLCFLQPAALPLPRPGLHMEITWVAFQKRSGCLSQPSEILSLLVRLCPQHWDLRAFPVILKRTTHDGEPPPDADGDVGRDTSSGGSGGRPCCGLHSRQPKVSLVESSGTFGEHGRGWPYMARCPFTPTPRPSLQESLNPSDLSPAVYAHLRLTRSGGWDGCACGSGPHWGSSLQL